VRERALSRRLLLRGTAVGAVVPAASGCARQESPRAAEPPDPETLLLGRLIAGKEQIIALYRTATLSRPRLAAALDPFERRHLAHLAELRRRLPGRAAGAASPARSAAGAASPAPSAAVGVARLRAAERDAAASRVGQLAGASPALAQLLACIGACESAHAAVLGRPPYRGMR
jgi:hypothetical protein